MPSDYKLLQPVGKGMTSQVFRAQDPTGKVVAVKELLPEHRKDPKRISSLEREARRMRELKHPNLVRILDYDPAKFRMVLEFLPRSLRGAMQKEPFHYEKRLRWALEATEGLVYLHDRHLVHKDLKPENIFLTEDGHAKLGDFGFIEEEAGFLDRLAMRIRKPRVQGTLAYLSPEQATQRPLTVKADIFSWGGVLYELFTGKLPFTPVAMGGGGDMGLIDQILTTDPRPPRELNPLLDKELEQLILGCLDKSRKLRPTAAYVRMALKRQLDKIK